MKKIIITLLISVLTLSFAACGGGKVSEVQININTGTVYSEYEIDAAINVVLDHFRENFDGCTLLRLDYDESATLAAGGEWAAQYGADEAIILFSDFKVDDSGGDGSLNPANTYTDWQWILTRSGDDPWTLQTWGY